MYYNEVRLERREKNREKVVELDKEIKIWVTKIYVPELYTE